MKIKSLLITVLACFVVIPAVVFAVTANLQMKDIALKNYTSATESMAEKQSYNISQYFITLSRTAKQIAENPYLTSYTSAAEDEKNDGLALKMFENYKKLIDDDNEASASEIEKIIVTDANGDLAFSTSDSAAKLSDAAKATLKKIADTNTDGVVYCYSPHVYANFDEEDKERDDPLFPKSTASGSSDLKLVVKYKSNKYNVFVFFGNERLKQFSTASQFATNSRLVLIDSMGSIIDRDYIGNTSDNVNTAFAKFVDNAGSGKANEVDNFKSDDAKAIPTIGFTIKIPDTDGLDMGWTAAMIAETDKAYVASGSAESSIIGVIVLMSIILIALAIILVFIITKPIKVIQETLLKVRRGDHEARINVIANNEYGEIARAFNDLIDDIIVSEGRYRTIIEMSDNIIFEWNFKSNEVFFSNNFNKKFSYRAPSDHFGDSFLLKVKVHPEDSERYHKDLEKLSKGEEFAGNEYRWKNIYGDYIWILLRTATIREREGGIAKIVGVVVDIDRAKKSEKLLTERASYDSLTGLYNRESIERTIDNEIDLISVRKSEFAILFIDVDDFKIYNDKYSHATGDQVLQFVAGVIRDITEGFGTAGRYGGDEFVACVRNVDVNEPTKIAKEILSTLKEGFVSDNGDKLSVNASIGISIIADASMRVDEIIGMADDAMYKIKKSGKSNFGILNKETVKSSEVPSSVDEEDILGVTE